MSYALVVLVGEGWKSIFDVSNLCAQWLEKELNNSFFSQQYFFKVV